MASVDDSPTNSPKDRRFWDPGQAKGHQPTEPATVLPAHLFRNRLAVVSERCYERGVSSAGSPVPQHVGRIVDPDVRDDGELEPKLELGTELGAESSQPVESEPQSDNTTDDVARREATVPLDGTSVQPQVEPSPTTAPTQASLALGESNRSSDAVPSPLPGAVPLDASDGFGQYDATHATIAGVTFVEPAIYRSQSVVEQPRLSEPNAFPQAKATPPAVDFEGLVDDDPPQRRSRELELVGDGLLARRRDGAGMPPRSPLSPNLIAALGALLGITLVASIIAIAMRLDTSRVSIEAVPSGKPAPSVAVAPAPEPTAPPKHRQREKVPGPYRIKDSANDPQLRIVEGQVGFDPFLKAVEKAGVPLKEAYRLLVAFEKVRPLSNTSRHDKFVAALDRSSKRLKAFEYITGPEEIFQSKEGEGGLLVTEKLDLKVKRDRVTGAFGVGEAGLERSVADSTFEPALLRSMREALIGHLSLEEIERGSRVRVIAQEVTALGEFARYAGIEALEILSPTDKKRLRVYFFNGPKSRGYFDETARAPYEGGWRSPIPNAPITSRFNMHRMHPVLHKVMPHTGIDFGAALGVPIGASSFGTITFLGWGGPTGNFIRIEHSGGVETGYAHMSRFAEGLKVGDKVKRLQTIGYVGSTGRSTGPHLHFTCKRDGKFVDPLTLNLDALRVLPSEERDVFLQQKAQYDAQLDAIELPPAPKGPTVSAPVASTSEGFEEEAEGDAPTASASAAPPAAPGAEGAAPTTGAPAPKSGSSLYLTDEELLRIQKSSESGEVEQ